MVDFNSYLRAAGIDPDAERIVILRHSLGGGREIGKHLPTLAEENVELFNAYQSEQSTTVERMMASATHVAAFIADGGGRALFVGISRITGSKPATPEEWRTSPQGRELMALGNQGPTSPFLLFQLEQTDYLAAMKGRLVIEFAGEANIARWAHRVAYKVIAIHEESRLVRAMPDWREIRFSYADLKHLPRAWKDRLAEWRAIYYIFDTSANLGYVGSAYGQQNLLQRWMNYDRTGDGGNKLLKGRDPRAFHFSILERPSPDMPIEQITALEGTWKLRLNTVHPHGLNDDGAAARTASTIRRISA